jgi:PAS domain S-box-containing protein
VLTHQLFVVFLSVAVAVLSASAAYVLASRAAASKGSSQHAWMLASSVALALGIWSMHFMGLLALRLPIRLHLDPWITAWSFLPALAGSWSLIWLARYASGPRPLPGSAASLLAALGLAVGVVGMHYLGMLAIDPVMPLVFSTASVLAASGWAFLVSLLAYRVYRQLFALVHPLAFGRVATSSLIMGLAIAGMHYLAMSGTTFGSQGLCITDRLHPVATPIGSTGAQSVEATAQGMLTTSPSAELPDLLSLALLSENVWLALVIFLLLMVVHVTGLLAAIYDARLADQNRRKAEKLAQQNQVLDQRAEDLSARLSHEQSVLKAALDATQDVIFSWCGHEKTFFVSQAVHQLFGLPAHQILTGLADLQALMQEEDADAFEKGIADMVSGQSMGMTLDVRIRRPNADLRWLAVRAQVTTATRRPMIVGAFTDITLLKQRELDALAVANQQRELAAFRGQMVRIVSHELRTPLTVLATGTELLRSRCQPSPGLPPEKMATYFQNMDDAVDQIKAVLSEVLQYNKLETGELSNTPRCIDLAAQIQQTVDLVCKAHGRSPSSVVVSTDATHDHLLLDAFLFEQVLRNLLTNALKYGERKPVFLRAVADDQLLSVEVEDQGLGLSPDLLPRLFQPFARGSNAAHLPGTGLGLSIAHRAAVVMGGGLRLLRSGETGSTFVCAVPVAPCQID